MKLQCEVTSRQNEVEEKTKRCSELEEENKNQVHWWIKQFLETTALKNGIPN